MLDTVCPSAAYLLVEPCSQLLLTSYNSYERHMPNHHNLAFAHPPRLPPRPPIVVIDSVVVKSLASDRWIEFVVLKLVGSVFLGKPIAGNKLMPTN